MDQWKERTRPACLEKRFEFSTYEETRDFLDKLGEFSEKINKYPDISFGKTYVNITIRPGLDDVNERLLDEDHKLASDIDKLYN